MRVMPAVAERLRPLGAPLLDIDRMAMELPFLLSTLRLWSAFWYMVAVPGFVVEVIGRVILLLSLFADEIAVLFPDSPV